MRKALALLALCGCLAGCTLGPNYARPQLDTPTHWAGAEPPGQLAPLRGAWWRAYGDPELDHLVATALAHSPDLQIVIERMHAAAALADEADSLSYPSVVASGQPSDPISAQLAAIGPAPVDVSSNRFAISLDAAYELDFWGRVRRGREAAGAEFQASRADVGTAYLGLVGAVVSTYFDLRAADSAAALDQQAQALARQRIELLQVRERGGLIGSAPLTRARLAMARLQRRQAAAASVRRQLRFRLAALMGVLPEDLHIAAGGIGHLQVPVPPVGLPSTLLQRRPDILAAEDRLKAANARIGIAKADFFPRISLVARYGYVVGAVRNLLEADSTVAGIGPEITLPIFEAGRNEARYRESLALHAEALAAYRKTVLQAFAEVEGDLDALATADRARRSLQREQAVLDRARRDEASAERGGLASGLDRLALEQAGLTLANERLANTRNRLDASLALYKALGGGWTLGPAAADQPTASSSTSKTRVALGGITPPAPRAP